MKHSYGAFAFLLGLTGACSGQNFHAGTQETTASSPAGSTAPRHADTSDAPPSEAAHPNQAVDVNESVAPPVQVSGTYLNCDSGLDELHRVSCELQSGFPADGSAITKAYIYTHALARWMDAPFRVDARGRYRISVPRDISDDFGVALSPGDIKTSPAAVVWVVRGLSTANLVADGGFEDYRIPAGSFYQLLESDRTVWKSARSSLSTCPEGRVWMEVQKRDPDSARQETFQGINRMELDTACERTDGVISTQNILAYQDLSVVPGNWYKVQFAMTRRAEEPDFSKIEVKFGDDILVNESITDTAWKVYEYTVKANTANMRTSFEDLGVENSKGTLIDAVNVVPLSLTSATPP